MAVILATKNFAPDAAEDMSIVTKPSDQNGSHERSKELSRCSRTVSICNGRTPRRFHSDRQEITRDGVAREYSGRNSCEYREYVDRSLRTQPYYFDINSAQDGTTERHYFDLRH
jgi:hypothetical protein